MESAGKPKLKLHMTNTTITANEHSTLTCLVLSIAEPTTSTKLLTRSGKEVGAQLFVNLFLTHKINGARPGFDVITNW